MRCSAVVIFLMVTGTLRAQDEPSFSKKLNIGLGIGLDYGGIGTRATFIPLKHLGLFTSVGYNLNAAGFNTGAQLLFPKRRNVFYITAMYGYNAVLVSTGTFEAKGTYYGVSAGAGYQHKAGRKGNFWNFELLVPFRTSNFYDDLDTLESMSIEMGQFLPVTFSVGYHFNLLRAE